ncbi:hypothetical protein [Microcoleus sp. B4-C3]
MNKKRAIALWDLTWERRSRFWLFGGKGDRTFGRKGRSYFL